MSDHFDASSAEPATSAKDALRRLQSDGADTRMLAFLDDMDDFIEESREHDRDEGLDPTIAALLEALTGREDAPYEFRALHRRVTDGATTWQRFWDAPEEFEGGEHLVNTAMRAAGADLDSLLRELDEGENPPPPGGVLR